MGSPLVTQTSPMAGRAIGATIGNDPVSLAVTGARVYIAAEGQGTSNDRPLFVASGDRGTSFGPVTSLGNAARRASSVRVAGHGDNVSVAWIEEYSPSPGNARTIAFVASSVDGGQTFGAPFNLSGEMDVASNVRISVYQDIVNVMWCRPQPGGGADLFIRRSTNAGGMFGAQQTLDDNVALCGNNHLSQVQQKVYAIWLGGNPVSAASRDILVKVSTDGGATFQPTVDVSQSSSRATQGVLAARGSNVYVAWEQVVPTTGGGSSTDIFFNRSTDDGRTFQGPVNLSVGNLDEDSRVPAIAAHGQYVHVLWDDGAFGDSDVFYTRSADNGATFGEDILLPTSVHDPAGDYNVRAVARGISLYAVWTRRIGTSLNSSIYYYSKRACPIWPSETGSLRCWICCN